MTPARYLRSPGTFRSVVRCGRTNNPRGHKRAYCHRFQPRGPFGLWRAPASQDILTRPVAALVKVSCRDPQMLKKRIFGGCLAER